MAERSIKHAGFVIERSYDASPAEVFAAWADPAAKARWFSGPEEWEAEPHEVDFRVGGHEVSIGGPKGGPVHTSSCASRHRLVTRRSCARAETWQLELVSQAVD